MLFEDLYYSILRRYRLSPPEVEQERQVPRGRLYKLLDTVRPESDRPAKTIEDKNLKQKYPSEWP